MLDDRLRLILVTDGLGDLERIEAVVRAAWAGGCRCVQLREPSWTAAEMWAACLRLRGAASGSGSVLLVNDRVDVAASGVADGAQVGRRSLPPDAARAALGSERLLGYSAHDAEELRVAGAADCDFALLSPVWSTSCKPDARPLGAAAASALTARSPVPVLCLGGVTEAGCRELAALPKSARPSGVAVMSAIMNSDDPERRAGEILAALGR